MVERMLQSSFINSGISLQSKYSTYRANITPAEGYMQALVWQHSLLFRGDSFDRTASMSVSDEEEPGAVILSDDTGLILLLPTPLILLDNDTSETTRVIKSSHLSNATVTKFLHT
jgi:hypothetical protein